MKKKNFEILAVVAFLVGMFVVLGIVGYTELHYSMDATVIELGNSNRVIVVDDKTNNEWCFYGTDFKIGDKVTLKMYTNETDLIKTDDVIENVERKGN